MHCTADDLCLGDLFRLGSGSELVSQIWWEPDRDVPGRGRTEEGTTSRPTNKRAGGLAPTLTASSPASCAPPSNTDTTPAPTSPSGPEHPIRDSPSTSADHPARIRTTIRNHAHHKRACRPAKQVRSNAPGLPPLPSGKAGLASGRGKT